MRRNTRRLILMSVTAAVWTAAISIGAQKQQLLARGFATLTIETDPKTIRVLINGERLPNYSRYMDTPTELSLRPGRHKITFERDGYKSSELTVDMISGETEILDNLSLEQSDGVEFITAEITTAEAPVRCDVDEGFIHGPTPLTVSELVVGQTHQLRCFPKWPSKEGQVGCKFTPQAATSENSSLKLRLWTKQGKLKISGCDKRPTP